MFCSLINVNVEIVGRFLWYKRRNTRVVEEIDQRQRGNP